MWYTFRLVYTLSTGTVLKTYSSYTNKTWTKEIKTFTVDADGDYNVGFYVHSPKNRYNVYLRGFTLSENVSVPAKPTAFSAVAAPNEEMKAMLSWTLPTIDTDGNTLTDAINSVVVSRDGEQIAELPGDAVSFEDDATTGLKSGFHTYSIYVTYGTQKSAVANATTKYVGPLEPFALPYAYDFEDESMWGLWTVVDVAGDAVTSQNPAGKTWSRWRNTALTGYLAVFSNPTSAATENDWLISPPLNFDTAGKYRLSFAACVYNGPTGGTCLLDVNLGDKPAPESMTANLAQYTSFKSTTYPATDGDLISLDFDVEAGGTYYIGMHEHANTVKRQVRIDDFKVEKIAGITTSLESVTAKKNVRINGNNIEFDSSDVTVVYSISGCKVAEYGSTDTVNISALPAGFYMVCHGKIVVKVAKP